MLVGERHFLIPELKEAPRGEVAEGDVTQEMLSRTKLTRMALHCEKMELMMLFKIVHVDRLGKYYCRDGLLVWDKQV